VDYAKVYLFCKAILWFTRGYPQLVGEEKRDEGGRMKDEIY
jgi:hypothetical protein